MGCLPCEQAARVLRKGSNITKAWVNVVIANPEVEALAVERLKVCADCSSRKLSLIVNGHEIYKCGECSCPLMALVRSEEKCKLNKWS